jgi:hypothetical protein
LANIMMLLHLLVDDISFFMTRYQEVFLLEHASPTCNAMIEEHFSCVWCNSFAVFFIM